MIVEFEAKGMDKTPNERGKKMISLYCSTHLISFSY